MPQFKYFLSHTNQSVQADSEIWSAPIPLSRKPLEGKAGIFVSHSDYFLAARDFLQKDDFQTIALAVSHQTRHKITFEEIEEIGIVLEKHGEFYHPARVETVLKGLTIPFVLNVAVSAAGINYIKREYRLLDKLNTDFPVSFLPRVFGQDCVYSKSADLEISMFLGEWLAGYNEFHLSRDLADDKDKIIVWDYERGKYFLTADQTIELYRQAARILTAYYNVETFKYIHSWHHAAGDFVVKCENNKVDVKLITVRQYRPMFAMDQEIKPANQDAFVVLEALLVFFLNLAIRMRLDRRDGTGDIVWLDDLAVQGIAKGFFEGLALKPPVASLPAALLDCFRKHLLSCSQSDLFDLSQAVVDAYNPLSPENSVIRKNLKRHVTILFNAIQQKQDIRANACQP